MKLVTKPALDVGHCFVYLLLFNIQIVIVTMHGTHGVDTTNVGIRHSSIYAIVVHNDLSN